MMKKILFIFILCVCSNCFSQIMSGRPGDADEVSSDVEDMSDEEYVRYEAKNRKANEKKNWIVFSFLVAGGIIYYIYSSNRKNK